MVRQSKVSLFVLMFFIQLHSTDGSFSQRGFCDAHLISLGPNCEVAALKKFLNLESEYFPFDFMFTSNFSAVCTLVQNRFYGFFDLKNLKLKDTVGNMQLYANTVYDGILFNHDFSVQAPIERYYREVLDKYQRRIERFYSALASEKPVFFFRRRVSRQEAKIFCEIIEGMYPRLAFTFVTLNSGPVTDFELAHVCNFHISEREWTEWHNPESMREWRHVYEALGLLPKEGRTKSVILSSLSDALLWQFNLEEKSNFKIQ